MRAEKKLMMTGKQYQEIKAHLQNNDNYAYNCGTGPHPEVIKITDISLDTDPEFTRNPKQYAKINDNMNVQVLAEFEL